MSAAVALSTEELTVLEEVVLLLRERRGVDLQGYRVATLVRRVRNRMIAANVASLDLYLRRLREDPAEPDALLERLTIKVSRFYRGAPAFEAVREALAVRRETTGRRLAVWSAGCGLGEEPYSLAMLLGSLQPPDDAPDVTATDIDPAALAAAARATYGAAVLEELPVALRARHLVAAGADRWQVEPALRRRVRLERHDLATAAAPPGAFDLVACRNTLIYFQPALQQRVLQLLTAGLLPGGLLWLGEAEWLSGPVAERFRVVDRRARLFALEPGSRDPGAVEGASCASA